MSELEQAPALGLALPARARAVSAGTGFLEKAVKAVYCAFLLAIPFETIVYYQSDDRDPGSSVSISRMIGIVLVGLALVKPRLCLRRSPLAFWLVAWYLAAYALSQLWIPAQMFPKFQAQEMTMLQMGALFLLSINVLSDPDFRAKALRLYGWWSVLVALAMIAGFFGTSLGAESRASISMQDANMTAWMFGSAAICLAGDRLLVTAKRRAALGAATLAAVGVLVYAVLETGSRSGLLAFGVGILALGVRGGGKGSRGTRAAIAALMLALGGLLVWQQFKEGTSTAARIERSWDEGDTAGRTEIYDAAWAMVRERPWTGYGAAYNRYLLGARLNYPDRDTHSVALAVLTEVGILGGAGFFLSIFLAMALAWRGAGRSGDALPFALWCATIVMSNSITASHEKLFWVAFAAAVAAGIGAARGGPARRAQQEPPE